MVTTISFVVGKGSLSHNNRTFIAENVVEERIELDEFYKQEPLEDAYDKMFGQAVAEYNAGQRRKDRKIDDYITKIKNSKNNEKIFYENVVQIGRMTDFGVVDENGNVTENALLAKEILDIYARTFQERNPNLYLFNAVLHMDEATPHLHLDYIPVAHGYKTGMKTRNSLTKGLQQMGIEKAVSKMDNEIVHWQEREREYLKDLCEERGIEIETLGVVRDDYTIPEYKAAMRAKDEAEAEVEILKSEKAELNQFIQMANYEAKGLAVGIDDKEEKFKEIEKRLKEAEKQRAENEKKIQDIAEDDKKISSELSKISNEAVNVPSLFGGEPMVKIPKKSFDKLMKICKSVSSFKRLFYRKDTELTLANKKIEKLQKGEKVLQEKNSSLERFIKEKGFADAFKKFLEPKSIKEYLREYKAKHIENTKDSMKKIVKNHYVER